MITTRFGSPVTLIGQIDTQGWVWVEVKHPNPSWSKTTFTTVQVREYHISELKADDGLNEIIAASEALKESK